MRTEDKISELERERDEALEKYNNLATEHMLVVNKLCEERDEAQNASEAFSALAWKLEGERNEAREHLREIKEYGTEEINAAVELRQKLAAALVERDEARVVASGLAKQAERLRKERDEASAWVSEIFRLLDLPAGDMGALENFRMQRDDARKESEKWKKAYETVSIY